MEYSDVIAELRRLLAEGAAILAAKLTHESPRFRNWRHEAESAVNAATASGLTLPGEFHSSQRLYMAMWSGADQKDNIAALNKGLSDSLIELRLIVDHFDKYGTPTPLKSANHAIGSLPRQTR